MRSATVLGSVCEALAAFCTITKVMWLGSPWLSLGLPQLQSRHIATGSFVKLTYERIAAAPLLASVPTGPVWRTEPNGLGTAPAK